MRYSGFFLGSMVILITVTGVDRAQAACPASVNNGTLTNTLATGNCGDFTNNGTMNNTALNLYALELGSGGVPGNFNSITNYGTMETNFNGRAINLQANSRIDALYNYGTIAAHTNNGNSQAINITGGSQIGLLYNAGTINSQFKGGIQTSVVNGIGTLTNIGTITGGAYSINNGVVGGISTLNNLQGVGNSAGALTLDNAVPNNYNIIINGNSYGQLNRTGGVLTGTMNYGVSTLVDTRTLAQGRVYGSVLQGITPAMLNNTTGKVGDRGTFTLAQNGANNWDMTIDGLWTPILGYMNPSVTNTYAALSSNRDAVSGALHQRYAVLNAVMEYDCSRFDKYGVCLSFQARATGWGDQTTGAGVFNIAKRITDNVRAGVYLDYQAAQATPFATNGYAGGIQWGYNNPTFGGYVGWSDHADGTGLQARVSGGYNPGKLTINRAMLDYSEPGSGTAGLNAYYAYGLAGYGISVGNGVIITPYGGLRYTDVTRNAYTENFNIQSVIFPLAYNAYYEQLITGLAGSKVQAMLTDKFGVNFALGGEFDLSRNANGYTGYSVAPGLQAWGVAHGGVWNGVRPAGIIGTFYDVNKNDRLMLNAYVGEQAWTSRAYSTLLAGYQVAF